MRKKILFISLLALILAFTGCGFPGEPMLDDMFTRDVFPGYDSTFQVGAAGNEYAEGYFDDFSVSDELDVGGITTFNDQISLVGAGQVYQQKTMPIQIARIIAAGVPTRVTRGIFQGFSLPVGGANEELFTCQCVPGNWDGTTDFILYVGGWIDTANDDKNFQLRVSFESWGSGDVIPAGSTDVDVETNTGALAGQFKSFKIAFTIDHTGILEGDALGIKLTRIAASINEMAGEFVVEGMILVYRADSLGSLAP
uniref:Uncharacterized protein n=1 Tax=viral metagenome TaxID=1070528 RepID=A0A6M3M8Q6_9ZZZZ